MSSDEIDAGDLEQIRSRGRCRARFGSLKEPEEQPQATQEKVEEATALAAQVRSERRVRPLRWHGSGKGPRRR